MKLLRYGSASHEKAGAVGSDGRVRDLSMLFANLDEQTQTCVAAP